MAEQKKVKVAHASFWYTGENGRHRVALRGDEIEIGSDDYARGKAHDAFETKAAKAEPEPEVTSDVPAKSASKAKWVEFATSADRGELALSTEDAEALTRDELADKFTPQADA